MSAEADITFAPATPEDFDYFYELRSKVMRPHVERLGLPWNEEWERQYHRGRFDPSTLRMIYIKGQPIGFIGVRLQGGDVLLELACLEPDFQKKGIGSQVMDVILNEPICRNRAVILDTLKGNPVAHLVERFGFMPVREDEKSFYYRRPPQPENHP